MSHGNSILTDSAILRKFIGKSIEVKLHSGKSYKGTLDTYTADAIALRHVETAPFLQYHYLMLWHRDIETIALSEVPP